MDHQNKRKKAALLAARPVDEAALIEAAAKKGMKLRKVENVPLDKIGGWVCGWIGCEALAPPSHDMSLPDGWRGLVIARGDFTNPQTIYSADHDKVLCPRHVAQLDSLLMPGGATIVSPPDSYRTNSKGWK